MKVLWITNILFPEAAELLKRNGEFKTSGGWMLGSALELINDPNIELSVATVSQCVSDLTILRGEKISYYILPYGKGFVKYNSDYEALWVKVNDNLKPDIVHIHGTEYSHGLAYVNACGKNNVVVSIQGMKSAYHQYYYYGLSAIDILKNITLRDIFRGTIIDGKKSFKYSGELEKELLSKVDHIIGRTSWDRARTWAINPAAHYHFCNETLRSEFYDGSLWNYEKCNKHSIFLSQATYPVKGLHQVLRAMPIILKHFPDASIRIAGKDITKSSSFRDLIHFTGYGKIIKGLISKYKLQDSITFTGELNGSEMKQEYLKCNVFICPSTIENSPNSLGEAQVLGVPCIASYVGGVPDMMEGDENNLYRFEEIEMLAYKVCKLFENTVVTNSIKNKALNRHSPLKNVEQLKTIYYSMLNT